MRPETITFLRKEAKEMHKSLPPSIGITEDQIFKKLKDEWKLKDRLDYTQLEQASKQRENSYKHVIMSEAQKDKKVNPRVCLKCGSSKTNTSRRPRAKIWCTECGYVNRDEGNVFLNEYKGVMISEVE